jgi:hypothetical protein
MNAAAGIEAFTWRSLCCRRKLPADVSMVLILPAGPRSSAGVSSVRDFKGHLCFENGYRRGNLRCGMGCIGRAIAVTLRDLAVILSKLKSRSRQLVDHGGQQTSTSDRVRKGCPHLQHRHSRSSTHSHLIYECTRAALCGGTSAAHCLLCRKY